MQNLNIQNLISAGAHFGHEVRKWNPKMRFFVHKEQGGIHLIDLRKTVVCAKKAFDFLEQTTAKGGNVIFVGTKPQAASSIEAAAQDSHQFYVNKKWLGGTLTNFETLKISIDRMKKIEQMKERFEMDRYSKKERSRLEKEYNKKEEFFKGIREMKKNPTAVFIIDIRKERIALHEARKLNIPVVALVDTNCDPRLVDFPIPANDDSARSIAFFTSLAGSACKRGQQKHERSFAHEQAMSEKTPQEKDPTPSNKEGGPQVVTLSKTRQLVAAGTAEDVEIEMELLKEEPKDEALDKAQKTDKKPTTHKAKKPQKAKQASIAPSQAKPIQKANKKTSTFKNPSKKTSPSTKKAGPSRLADDSTKKSHSHSKKNRGRNDKA